MSIRDALDAGDLANTNPPKRYQKHAEFDESGGTAATGPVREIVTDYDQLLRLAGLDPESFRITGRVQQWTKTHHDREDTYSFFFSFEPITDEDDESPLARELASKIQATLPTSTPTAKGLPKVVGIADGQMGKDGPGSASPEEMDDRFHDALGKIVALVKEEEPSMLIIADAGDPIEGITSSAPNQIATNTLELPDQLRLWQRRLTETILSLAPYAGETHVAVVPSNHGEIRNQSGKVGYGDYGIGVARNVEEAFAMLDTKHDLTFHYPDSKYDVVTYVPVDGKYVAFSHGDHAKQHDRVPQWVANQAASMRSKMRDATIFCHGHYHTPGYRWSRGREIVSFSMFDSGSPWFENLTGEYSFPAVTTFDVKNNRVSNLRFIEP